MGDAQAAKLSKTSELPDELLRAGDTLLHGQYRIESYLGVGGFGVTYLAKDSLNRRVVIKECFPNALCTRSNGRVHARTRSQQAEYETVVKSFREEALRMAKLKHPNIVGVHQVFEDNATAYIALDFIKGRNLLEIIEDEREELSPEAIKRILLQLLDAISYVHQHEILHRDISPDNILLDDVGKPILIDFGASREQATRASRALSALHIVKDGYSPQEFYLSNGVQTESSDIYSLAATFYHLIMGKPPPNSQVRLAALAAEELDPYVEIPPRTPGYDGYFLGAIDKALAVFPKHRLQSATEWIEEIDQVRRQQAMRERAKKDKEMELSIRRITEECNHALMVEMQAEPQRGAKVSTPAAKASGTGKAKVPAGAAPTKRTGPAAPKKRRAAPRTHSNHDEIVAKGRAERRRRSLFSRLLYGSIWLVMGSKNRAEAKTRGDGQ